MDYEFSNQQQFLKEQNKIFYYIILFCEIAYLFGVLLVIPNGSVTYPSSVLVIGVLMALFVIAITVISHYVFKTEKFKQFVYVLLAGMIYTMSNLFYLKSLGTSSSFVWFALFMAVYFTQNKYYVFAFSGLGILYYAATFLMYSDSKIIIISKGYYYNRFIAITVLMIIAYVGLGIFSKYRHTIIQQFKELNLKNLELEKLNREVLHTKEVLEDQYSKVYQLAYYDSLTGLGNRRYFNDYLSDMIRENSKQDYAVVIIDIINMKFINDTFSHEFGDLMISKVSEIISEFFHKEGFVGRIGGDEFVVIINNKIDIRILGEQLLMLFNQTVHVKDIDIKVNVNIALLDNPESKMSREEVLKNVDLTLVHTKKKNFSHSSYVIFEPSMSEEAYEKYYISLELAKAIEEKVIQVVYQPKYDTITGEIKGFEALARWHHPVLGQVSPEVFVKIAEQHGFIESLTDIVIRKSCKFAKKINAKNSNGDIRVTINISGLELIRENFYQRLIGLVFNEEVSPNYVGIEITETAVMESLDEVVNTLERVRQSGIEVSLDDFGTGYSSLNYLRKLQIDELKIDKSFIDHICEDQNDEYMIKMIISLAKTMHIKTIAEGVEDKAQYEILKRLNCDMIQGYYFSKPLSYNEGVLLAKTQKVFD